MADSTKNITKVPLEHMDWEQVEDNLRETKDSWWLNEIDVDGKKKTQLEIALEKGRSFKKEELLAPNKWLTPENYQTYVRRVVEIIQKFKDENKTLDGNTDKAFEALKEELKKINESNTNLGGHRKPHTAFATHTKKLKVKRLDAWHDLKQFAQKSRGENQIDLPGYGLTFLKMDKDIAKGNLRYKDTAFENPNDGYLITKKAFDSAWDKA